MEEQKGRGELQMRNEGVRLNESKENVVNGETKLLLDKQSKINGRGKTEKAKWALDNEIIKMAGVLAEMHQILVLQVHAAVFFMFHRLMFAFGCILMTSVDAMEAWSASE